MARCSVCGQEKRDVMLRDPCKKGDPMCGELANYYCAKCWIKRSSENVAQIEKLSDIFVRLVR
jgi:hypothetical protein